MNWRNDTLLGILGFGNYTVGCSCCSCEREEWDRSNLMPTPWEPCSPLLTKQNLQLNHFSGEMRTVCLSENRVPVPQMVMSTENTYYKVVIHGVQTDPTDQKLISHEKFGYFCATSNVHKELPGPNGPGPVSAQTGLPPRFSDLCPDLRYAFQVGEP